MACYTSTIGGSGRPRSRTLLTPIVDDSPDKPSLSVQPEALIPPSDLTEPEHLRSPENVANPDTDPSSSGLDPTLSKSKAAYLQVMASEERYRRLARKAAADGQ